MKIFKKLTTLLLIGIFAFLIVGQSYRVEVNASGSEHWTLNEDGYYYLEHDVLLSGAFVLESHNGNEIHLVNKFSGNIYANVLNNTTVLYYEDERGSNYNIAEPNGDDFSIKATGLDFRYWAGPETNPDFGIEWTLTLGFYNYELYLGDRTESFTIKGETAVEYRLGGNPTFITTNETTVNVTFIYDDRNDTYNINLIDSNNEYINGYTHLETTDSIFFRYRKLEDPVPILGIADLPSTIGDFDNGLNGIGTVNIERVNSELYNIEVIYLGHPYTFTLNSVPEYIYQSRKVYYFSDKQEKYFVGFYEFQDRFTITNNIVDNLADNSWIYWNLTTGEYIRSEVNVIRGAVTVKSANRLYIDIVIPHNITDLLSIIVEYNYQYKWLIGEGDWHKKTDVLLTNEGKSPIAVPWGTDLTGLFNKMLKTKTATKWFGDDQITKIDITTSYKNNFVTKYNDHIINNGGIGNYTANQLFPDNSNAYQLYLGTFVKFPSIGLNTKDFEVLAYRYVYKGVEYSVINPPTSVPDYEHENPFWDKANSFLDKTWDFFTSFAPIGIALVALATYSFVFAGLTSVFGKKISKHRTMIFIVYAVALYLVWIALTK